MRIKISFEIGHTPQLKAKASPEGFTHDWELFVRGADGTNISTFVDKIVFNLHDSFPKPCRIYKEPPYILKESGYASFNLPIDIYLKAGPRDEPKKYSITYDLDISKRAVQKYPLIITNPSSEFRHKLLEGGGIMINSEGHPSDERTYLQPDSTTKPRPASSSGSSGSGKKHKTKSDDLKPTSTFENLFGSPIFNSKNSPDPKLSNSSSSSSKVPIMNSGGKIPPQKPSKERSSDKSGKEKRDKKDKAGSTPKEGSKESSSKKSEEKHERREEKRKEKSSTKDRERSKEKSAKRPPSPKPTSRSPKRSASPARASSSNSNRHESISTKYEEKSSSSSGKKSKKEKRDKSKERDRSSGDKGKDSKHQMQQNKAKEDKPSSKSMEKLNGSSKKEETESKDRDKGSKYRFDKPPSPVDVPMKIATPTDTKKSHDKDERKHKHKKKDKNKDKDRKKSKSKDISDESPSSRKRTNAQTPVQANRVSNAKPLPAPMPQSNQMSDKSSSEFEDDDYGGSPKADKVSSSNDTNHSMDHMVEPIPEIVTPRTNQIDSPKKHAEKSSGKKGKREEPKSNQSSTSKDEKKKKRKSKSEKQKHDDSGASGKRKSPLGNDEPPTKLFKKDDEKMPKNKDENQIDSNKLLPGRTPPVPPHLSASPSTQKNLYHQSPDSSKQVNMKRSADSVLSNQSKLAHISSPTTSSSSSPATSERSASPHPQPTESPSEKQYIAQLRALQQKIMTLQDNEELQQVVEMIAATGCYEITNKTFDFDLCALDRSTVQRLQERLG